MRIFPFVVFIFLITSSALAEERYSVPIGNSPSYGPENAPVTIIEFIDYQ